jgi:hypothetical protein
MGFGWRIILLFAGRVGCVLIKKYLYYGFLYHYTKAFEIASE